MSLRHLSLIVGLLVSLSGCAEDLGRQNLAMDEQVQAAPVIEVPMPVPPPVQVAWGEPAVHPMMPRGPRAVAQSDGPYLLDTGDRLRIFVYGQPNLSRIYPVDHSGRITVPLIGRVRARGRTTRQMEIIIRDRLGAKYVKDPKVNVDINQHRPFFILGEVRNAGQYPYVGGLTVQSAIAIAGGYSERANESRVEITRRVNGYVDKMQVPTDYVVKPGDTINVPERFF